MKKVKGSIWMSVIVLGILLLLGWTVWQNLRVSERIDNSVKSTTMLEGEYSLDGGEQSQPHHDDGYSIQKRVVHAL